MWVKVRLRRPGSGDERVVSAYANGGFRAGEPSIMLPPSLAVATGFSLKGESVGGLAVGGLEPEIIELGELEVRVEVPDRPHALGALSRAVRGGAGRGPAQQGTHGSPWDTAVLRHRQVEARRR